MSRLLALVVAFAFAGCGGVVEAPCLLDVVSVPDATSDVPAEQADEPLRPPTSDVASAPDVRACTLKEIAAFDKWCDDASTCTTDAGATRVLASDGGVLVYGPNGSLLCEGP